MATITTSSQAGLLIGDRISIDGQKHYRVTGVKAMTLTLRPWRWWDTLAAFIRRTFYRLTHRSR